MAKKSDHNPPGFYEAVYRLVREIPRGRVMTYGQIATILGQPRAARAVGYAMRACGQYGDDIPWQRVINHKGGISARTEAERPTKQLQLLKKEGVKFRDDETCDLKKYRWEPPDPDEYVFVTEKDLPFK